MERGCVTAFLQAYHEHTYTSTKETPTHGAQRPAQHEDCESLILNLILQCLVYYSVL